MLIVIVDDPSSSSSYDAPRLEDAAIGKPAGKTSTWDQIDSD
jgi:hypothetical protein